VKVPDSEGVAIHAVHRRGTLLHESLSSGRSAASRIRRTRRRNLDPAQRLALHQSESAAPMKALEQWMQRQFDERQIEPNAALGAAILYMQKRWSELTLFLRVEGVPLDERALKKAILHRKNALFYRTLAGARRRRVYEPDPHRRTQSRRPVRVSGRPATECRGPRREPCGLDALELSGRARQSPCGSGSAQIDRSAACRRRLRYDQSFITRRHAHGSSKARRPEAL
jgi:hypothetical protein